MTKEALFNFSDPDLLSAFKQHVTTPNVRRPSGTIDGSVKHSIIHTNSPNATLHHIIIAMCPHPLKSKADAGDNYMVAYVSIPMRWLISLSTELINKANVSFIGPAGTIQKLPPALKDIEDLLKERVYVGFDWLAIDSLEDREQPSYESVKGILIDFVNALRTLNQEEDDELL